MNTPILPDLPDEYGELSYFVDAISGIVDPLRPHIIGRRLRASPGTSSSTALRPTPPASRLTEPGSFGVSYMKKLGWQGQGNVDPKGIQAPVIHHTSASGLAHLRTAEPVLFGPTEQAAKGTVVRVAKGLELKSEEQWIDLGSTFGNLLDVKTTVGSVALVFETAEEAAACLANLQAAFPSSVELSTECLDP